MQWNEYWTNFIKSQKLSNKVRDMNQVDINLHGKCQIEDICHKIYDDYELYKNELERIRNDLLAATVDFQGVHLQTNRVKSIDSLLKKVIEGRNEHLLNKSSLYSTINGNNYKEIITDLIGIRFIIDYRGKWADLHQNILKSFPYVDDMEMYSNYKFIPHSFMEKSFIAEMPKAYYAFGDDVSMYERAGIKTKMKENGYRSVHYVISFQDVYVEIQVRTIYDEAWSDCDHNYVYKKENHSSHAALKEMSIILNLLTNAANDLGETMQEVYSDESICEISGKYKINPKISLQIRDVFDRIKDTQQCFEDFQKREI